MSHKDLMSKLFDYNATTYYAWRKQSRPIIRLIEKYFSDEEIQEFLDTGSVKKLEENDFSDYLLLESSKSVNKIKHLFPKKAKVLFEKLDELSKEYENEIPIEKLATLIFREFEDDIFERRVYFKGDPTGANANPIPTPTLEQSKLELFNIFQNLEKPVYDYLCKYSIYVFKNHHKILRKYNEQKKK
mgnify:CR=1 FL=1